MRERSEKRPPEAAEAEKALLESEREFRSLVEAMPQIVWATRPDGATIYFNQQWVDYTGMTLEESYGDGWNTPFHPDDRQRARDAWQRATRDGAPYSLACRLRRADGAYRWWLIRGSPSRDASGAIVKWFGTCTDIEDLKLADDALRESEARYRMLFTSLLEGFAYCRMLYDDQGHPDDFVYLSVNPAFEKLTGLRDVVGKRVTEILPTIRDETPELLQTYAAVARTGEPAEFEIDFTPLGLWLHVSASRPEPDHFVAVFEDVTARKRAEARAAQMTRLYATLSEVNQAIVRTREPSELYRTVCDIAVEFGDFSVAWVGLFEEASGDVRPVAANGIDVAAWPFETINIHRGVARDGLVATAIRSRQVVFTSDVESDARMRGVLGQFKGRGYHSIAAIPFEVGGAAAGVLVLVSPRAGLFRETTEVNLLEEMSIDISFALGTMAADAERRRADDALRESERQYRELFETSPVPMSLNEVVGDIDGGPADYRFVHVNPAFERLMGMTAASLVGHTILEVAPLVDRTMVERACRVGLTGVRDYFEGHSAGLDRDHETTVYSPRHGQFVTYVVDVTERKRAAAALIESEEKHRVLFETMSEGIVYEDADGTITSANPAAERLLGLSLDQLQGRTSLDPRWKAIHEDGSDWPGETHPIPAALRTGKPTTDDVQGVYNPQTGEYVWLSINATPEFRPGETRPFRAYAVFRNITERKRAERQLAAQATRLKVLADMAEALIAAGPELQQLLDQMAAAIAKAFASSCHLRLPSLGRTWLDVVALPDEDPDELEAERHLVTPDPIGPDAPDTVSQVFRTGQASLVPVVQPDRLSALVSPHAWPAVERLAPHSVIIVPLRARGDVMGVLTLTRYKPGQPPLTQDDLLIVQELADRAALAISNARLAAEVKEELAQRKLAEEGLRSLNETLEERVLDRTAALEAANRELEAFSYSVSHDLRAPLRHIDGFGTMLLEEHAAQLDEEGRRLLGRVVANSHQMGFLVDDLLAFSRVARKELEARPVDMDSLVRAVWEDLRTGEPGRQIEFDLGDLGAVPGDQALLRQVWANVIGNAVKFTRPVERPRIEVRCEIRGGMCRYAVRDNGVGFDPRYAGKLFQPFQRLHQTTEFEGTGIGLAIVARIVQRHGGTVWAEGAPGAGATFGFSVPEERVTA